MKQYNTRQEVIRGCLLDIEGLRRTSTYSRSSLNLTEE